MTHLLGYLAMRAGVGLVGLLPRRSAVRIGTFVFRFGARFFPGRRAMVERHGRRLGIAEDALPGHVSAVFANYGRYWAEVFWTRRRRSSAIQATLLSEGLAPVRAAVEQGRGMVFAVPHLGNWEFAGLLASQLGFELVAVAENLANRRIRDWFVRVRESMGIEIYFPTRSTIRRLEEALKAGKSVALVCDRDLSGTGVTVRFFGEETTLPAGPVRLATRTGAPLIPVAVYFTQEGHRVHVRSPIDLDGLPPENVLEQGTELLAKELENLIGAAPEQWHLLQPNWPSDTDLRETG